LDIEHPESPRIDQVYDAGGKINDAHDVKVGMTNVSLYAYVADGRNGLRVVQLTSPETPGNDGFSPRPTPQLIASSHTHGPALAISEGLDRDRAVDESGNQLAVFGRRGARPMNEVEMKKLYMRADAVWAVPEIKSDDDMRRFFGSPGAAGAAEHRDGGAIDRVPKTDQWLYMLGAFQWISVVAVVLVPFVSVCLWRYVKG